MAVDISLGKNNHSLMDNEFYKKSTPLLKRTIMVCLVCRWKGVNEDEYSIHEREAESGVCRVI